MAKASSCGRPGAGFVSAWRTLSETALTTVDHWTVAARGPTRAAAMVSEGVPELMMGWPNALIL